VALMPYNIGHETDLYSGPKGTTVDRRRRG
jgi:hypothetical protein